MMTMTTGSSGMMNMLAKTANAPHASEAARAFGKAPAALVEEIQDSAARMFAAAAASGRAGADVGAVAPALRAPDMPRVYAAVDQSAETMTPEAALAMLLAMLQEILGDLPLIQLKNKLEMFLQQAQARKRFGENLSAELAAALQKESACLEQAKEAAAAAEAAQTAAEEARKEAERLQKQLEAADPESPEYDSLAAQATAAAARAEGLATAATAAATALTAALAEVEQAGKEVKRITSSMDGMSSGMPRAAPPADEHRTNAARIAELLAMLTQITRFTGDQKLKNDIEFAIQQLKAREADNKRISDEFAKEMERAAEAEKTMGCVGKVIGWVITVAAVIAAPFTGGASMALAAIGLALAIAEEVSGESILGKAFEPLVTHVLQPLMKFFSDIYTAVATTALKAVGVDAAEAEKIGGIIGTVMGALAMVGVMVLAVVAGKAAARQLVQKFGDVLMRNMAKVLPDILKNAGKAVAQAPGSAKSALARQFPKLAGYGGKAATHIGKVHVAIDATRYGNQVGQGVGNSVVAGMRVDAAKLMAELDNGLLGADLMRKQMDYAFDQFVRSNDVVEWLSRKMSDILAQDSGTARFVVNNIARA